MQDPAYSVEQLGSFYLELPSSRIRGAKTRVPTSGDQACCCCQVHLTAPASSALFSMSLALQ